MGPRTIGVGPRTIGVGPRTIGVGPRTLVCCPGHSSVVDGHSSVVHGHSSVVHGHSSVVHGQMAVVRGPRRGFSPYHPSYHQPHAHTAQHADQRRQPDAGNLELGDVAPREVLVALLERRLGHRDVRTTMIYAQVPKRGGDAVQSPGDLLPTISTQDARHMLHKSIR